MKNGLIHLAFCIDSSGSMYDSVSDVIGGYKKMIEEQKAVKEGECIVSLYTFDSTVDKHFLGKKLDEVGDLDYMPKGMTKLYDGVGTCIDEIGEWLSDMKEEDRPSKNIIAVITDGEENYSKEYTLKDVKDRIKTQQDIYSWDFVFLGNDLSNAKDAHDMGFKYKAFTTKSKFSNNYDIINNAATAYRSCADAVSASLSLNNALVEGTTTLNAEYKKDTGIDLS